MKEEKIILTDEQKALKKKYLLIQKMLSVIICLGVFFVLYTNIVVASVPTSSMYPTYNIREFVLIDKISDPYQELKHEDILLFKFHNADGTIINLCKRLIGMPGDSVEVKTDGVYLNGEKLDQPYHPDPTTQATMAEITLGDNEFFVMGDNWNNSEDSRFFGPISGDDIIGHAFFNCEPLKWFNNVSDS